MGGWSDTAFNSQTGMNDLLNNCYVISWNAIANAKYHTYNEGTWTEGTTTINLDEFAQNEPEPDPEPEPEISGDTSGEIIDIPSGIVNGNEEYWGSIDDINKENQENLISGNIENAMNSISGEMQKNEIFRNIK